MCNCANVLYKSYHKDGRGFTVECLYHADQVYHGISDGYDPLHQGYIDILAHWYEEHVAKCDKH